MKLAKRVISLITEAKKVKIPTSKSEVEEMIDDMIDAEIKNMLIEINNAEVATGLSREGDDTSRVTGRWYSNTFPKWYRTVGARNKGDLYKIASSKKGHRYKKLADVAKERLLNGYKTAGDYSPPDNTFRALMDLPAYDDDGSEVPF